MKEFLFWGGAIGGFALSLFVLERFFPLRRAKRPRSGRLLVNLTFAAIAFVTVSLTVRPAAEATLDWTARSAFGLAQMAAIQPILACLLMDLTFYWWHRANHRFPLLWRFAFLASGHAAITEPVSGAGTAGIVEAMSQTLAELSRRIAREVIHEDAAGRLNTGLFSETAPWSGPGSLFFPFIYRRLKERGLYFSTSWASCRKIRSTLQPPRVVSLNLTGKSASSPSSCLPPSTPWPSSRQAPCPAALWKIHRLLGPESAIVVEYGDTLGRWDEVR